MACCFCPWLCVTSIVSCQHMSSCPVPVLAQPTGAFCLALLPDQTFLFISDVMQSSIPCCAVPLVDLWLGMHMGLTMTPASKQPHHCCAFCCHSLMYAWPVAYRDQRCSLIPQQSSKRRAHYVAVAKHHCSLASQAHTRARQQLHNAKRGCRNKATRTPTHQHAAAGVKCTERSAAQQQDRVKVKVGCKQLLPTTTGTIPATCTLNAVRLLHSSYQLL
jgi:hypothetical protein